MGNATHSAAGAVVLAMTLAGCYLTSPRDAPHGDPCEAFEQDVDGDGWGDCSDCDDHDPQVHPGVLVDGGCCGVMNGRDDDCDGAIDEDPNNCEIDCGGDLDGDGYFSPADCDDGDAAIHPNAFDGADSCTADGDGIDDDCDGLVDEDWIGEPEDGCDQDGDGWAAGEDCDDRDPGVNPGVWEDVCCRGDGRDNDCDGLVDESMDADAECGPCDVDQDGDGWASADDCDDGDATKHPGRTEYCCPCGDGGGGDADADADADGPLYPDCNGVDDDCDGLVDETSLSLAAEDEFCCNY